MMRDFEVLCEITGNQNRGMHMRQTDIQPDSHCTKIPVLGDQMLMRESGGRSEDPLWMIAQVEINISAMYGGPQSPDPPGFFHQ
jgi:hypothetical protein